MNEIQYSEVIEYYASRKGFTLTALFRASNVPAQTYYSSKAQNQFSTKVLEKLAKALEVDVADLVRPVRQPSDWQQEIEAIKARLDYLKRIAPE